jgi:RNA polymerase sigma-B factor
MNEIFNLYFLTRNLTLRNKLVTTNLGLARKVAHSMDGRCIEPYEDLEQLAIQGLIKAVERFNPETCKYFSSFALPYIRGEIQHYLRDKASPVRIPRNLHERQARINRSRRRLLESLGRSPSNKETAEYMGVEVEFVLEAQNAARNLWAVGSLEAPIGDEDLTLGDTLIAQNQEIPDFEKLAAELRDALAGLEPRYSKAVKGYLAEGIFAEEEYKRKMPRKSKVTRRALVSKAVKQLSISALPLEEAVKLASEYANNADALSKAIWSQVACFLTVEQQTWFYNWLRSQAQTA